jgi:hypothetical protein
VASTDRSNQPRLALLMATRRYRQELVFGSNNFRSPIRRG